MKRIAASEFKARCLRIMDEVRTTREPVSITKKGRVVAKLVPITEERDDLLGCLEGRLEILGDIESPVVRPDEWKANR